MKGCGLPGRRADAELDHDVVGDDVEGLPGALADREVAALDGQAALEHAGVALRREGGRDDDVLARALDRQRADDLVVVAAERLDGAGLEARSGEVLGVEPGLACDLAVTLGGDLVRVNTTVNMKSIELFKTKVLPRFE